LQLCTLSKEMSPLGDTKSRIELARRVFGQARRGWFLPNYFLALLVIAQNRAQIGSKLVVSPRLHECEMAPLLHPFSVDCAHSRTPPATVRHTPPIGKAFIFKFALEDLRRASLLSRFLFCLRPTSHFACEIQCAIISSVRQPSRIQATGAVLCDGTMINILLALFDCVRLRHFALGIREIDVFTHFPPFLAVDHQKQRLATFLDTAPPLHTILIICDASSCLFGCERPSCSPRLDYFSTFSGLFTDFARVVLCTRTTSALLSRRRAGSIVSLYSHNCRDSCGIVSF